MYGIIDSNQKITGPPSLNLQNDFAQIRSYPGSGTSVTDLSGNSTTGTLVNSPTFSTGNGGYLSFNGTNNYINYGSNIGISNITYDSDGTFCMWIYPTRNNQFLIGKNDGSNALGYGYVIFINSGNGISFTDIRDVSNGRYNSTSGLTLNTWNHITVVWVTSTGAYFYINGSAGGSPASYLGSGIKRDDQSFNLQFGFYTFADGAQLYYAGNMSELQIYKRALTSTEVLTNYQATKSRYGL